MTRFLSNHRLMLFFFAAISAAALAAAYAAQYGFGLAPCILCLYQRIPYAIIIVLGLIGALWQKYPRSFSGVIALTFLANSVIAFYHTGVEQKWWKSFIEGCSSPDLSGNIEDLMARIEAAPVAACDSIPWQDPLIGLSMANYNVLFCAGLAIIALLSALCPTSSSGRLRP